MRNFAIKLTLLTLLSIALAVPSFAPVFAAVARFLVAATRAHRLAEARHSPRRAVSGHAPASRDSLHPQRRPPWLETNRAAQAFPLGKPVWSSVSG